MKSTRSPLYRTQARFSPPKPWLDVELATTAKRVSFDRGRFNMPHSTCDLVKVVDGCAVGPGQSIVYIFLYIYDDR